jgi:hypothetical protein
MVQQRRATVLKNERLTASRLLPVHATDRLEMIGLRVVSRPFG